MWGRRQQDRASRQQGYLTGVLETSATLASTSVTPAVLDGVATQIGEVLGGMESVRFADRAPADAPRLRVEGCAWPGGRSIDVDAEGLPTDDVVVLAAGRSGAAFLITSATAVRRPGRQQRQVALTLAAQVGAALDRDAMLR